MGRRYQLRHAAGLYWLLDMEQSGTSYVSPLPLNEAGAQILQMLADGMSENEIGGRLCEKYGVSPGEAKNDVRDFIMQLKDKKFDLGGVR
ncbi:MAG: PqqD family protein [Oscillospiraceae bacterium]|nr:PqqD family protein [Oscillospiraceae bacterium]